MVSTIAENLADTWTGGLGLPIFVGQLTNVTYTITNDTFNGHVCISVDRQFGVPKPCMGAIVQLVATTQWFAPDVPLTVQGGYVSREFIFSVKKSFPNIPQKDFFGDKSHP